MAAIKPDYSEVPTENLSDMVLRHEKAGITNTLNYLAATEELARRLSKSLNPEITIRHLVEKARGGVFTSYKAIADANGADWAKVHWQIPEHLDHILQICHARSWPLLTAICVNGENVSTGDLAPTSLAGFIKGAKRLRYEVVDDHQFLKRCQTGTFEWARDN
jgi:hypothetical protein